MTFEQEYPTPAQEMKIIHNVAMTVDVDDEDFCKRFVTGQISSARLSMMVVLRRSSLLVAWFHIIRAYSIFGNKGKAIDVCTARFDDETKTAFMELYDKVDADFVMPSEDSVDTNTAE